MLIERNIERENALAKETYKFYDLNRDALNEGHIGEYVVIHNAAVIGYVKEQIDGFDILPENVEPGSFIIHQCLPEEEDFDDIGWRVPTPAFEIDWR